MSDDGLAGVCQLATRSENYALGHEVCHGNVDVRAGGYVAVRLRCGCACHQRQDADGPATVEPPHPAAER